MITNGKFPHRTNHLILRFTTFHGQRIVFMSIIAGYEALKNEKAQSDDTKLREIEAWAEKTCMRTLQNVGIVDREDGLHLTDLAIKQVDRKPLSE